MQNDLAQLVTDYQTSTQTVELILKTHILLLVGPTGAGKDTLKDKLLETGDYHHIVSHTTRPPRINHGVLELDGLEYHFIDHQQARNMLLNHEFVEAKFYSGNIYGTSVSEIQAAHDKHKIAMTDIEVQGVAEYKAFDPNVMAIFLLPPSFEDWQQRLQRRYGDVVDAADVRIRMETALDELDQLLTTNYYQAFINDDLETTLQAVQAYANSGEVLLDQNKAAHSCAKKLQTDIRRYLTTSLN